MNGIFLTVWCALEQWLRPVNSLSSVVNSLLWGPVYMKKEKENFFFYYCLLLNTQTLNMLTK